MLRMGKGKLGGPYQRSQVVNLLIHALHLPIAETKNDPSLNRDSWLLPIACAAFGSVLGYALSTRRERPSLCHAHLKGYNSYADRFRVGVTGILATLFA